MSDLDIAVYLDEPSRAQRAAVYRKLLRQLGHAVGNGPVDLVLLNDAPPALAGRIIAGRLLFSADERRRVGIETDILSQQQDLLPMLRQYDRLLHDRVAAGLFGHRSVSMIDRDTVNDRLAYVQTTLQQLHARRELDLATLRSDPDKRGAALYELQTCIEAMSDIANHIIAATGLPKPRDRGEAFSILAQEGILPADLAARLVEAVGMRNILVHGYLGIVLDVVHQALQNDLPDIEAYARHIVAYLKSLSEDTSE